MQKYFLGLKSKLLIPIIAIVSLSLFIAIGMVTSKSETVLLRGNSERLRNISLIIGNSILQKIDRAKSDITFAAQVPQFAAAIRPEDRYVYPSREVYIESSNALLKTLGDACGYYETFYVADHGGMTRICSLDSAVATLDISNRDWFHAAMQTDAIVVSEPFRSRITGDALVAVAKRFEIDGQKGLMIGSLQINKITHAVLATESMAWLNTVIITRTGMTMASLDDSEIASRSYAHEEWFPQIQEKPSGLFETTVDGHTKIVSFYNLPGTDLITLSFIDKDHVLAPVQKIVTYGNLALIIAIVLTSIVVYTVVSALTKDIFKLSSFAHRVADGDITGTSEIKRLDELGTLAYSIDHMVQELNAMIVKAEEATKAKSDFLARMSHEIRTPMNAIIGMAHIGLQNNPEEKQRRFLEKIQQAAVGLLGIINDILDFSKVEAGKLELELTTFRLSGLIRSMSDLLEERAKSKGLELTFTVDPDVPDILLGDSLRISQICINLCSNALKFTETGGVYVHISIDRKEKDSIYLLFRIKDTGIGLEQDQTSHIFEAFSQADGSTTRRYGGTGLGLAICQRLVHMMNGTIWVDSVPGQGSTFSFTVGLGMVDETEESLSSNHPEEQPATPHSKFDNLNVLLVDDNELNLEIGQELLQQIGISPMLADNGAEALELCKEQVFDMVLMDIHMPVMDGLEATRKIRKLDSPWAKTMPIIAMTANAMSGDRDKSLAAGMNDHLTKPINFAELHQTISRWQPAKPK